MPNNKNAIVRYQCIDEMLHNWSHYYTTHDIQEACNDKLSELKDDSEPVTLRCIQKDLNFLENYFGASIMRYTAQGKRCVKYEDPTFSIFSPAISQEEKNLLTEVLATLGQFKGLDNFDWLESLRRSLNFEQNKKRIIEFSKSPDLKNENLLGELFDCISKKIPITLRYKPFGKPESSYTVYPYLLKQYNNRWFLIATEELKERISNFALDRIQSIERKPDLKYEECPFDLEDLYKNIYGVSINKSAKIEEIVFWVSDKTAPYIETKKILESQRKLSWNEREGLSKEYPNLPKNGCVFAMTGMVNRELRRELCSYFEDLEVLKPRTLRDKIIQDIEKMSEKYSNNEPTVR